MLFPKLQSAPSTHPDSILTAASLEVQSYIFTVQVLNAHSIRLHVYTRVYRISVLAILAVVFSLQYLFVASFSWWSLCVYHLSIAYTSSIHPPFFCTFLLLLPSFLFVSCSFLPFSLTFLLRRLTRSFLNGCYGFFVSIFILWKPQCFNISVSLFLSTVE